MKGILVLLVRAVAGLAGVFYFRRYLAARAPVVASSSAPAKDEVKERRRRRRHGARRMARSAGSSLAAAPPVPSEAPAGEAPGGGGPTGDGTPRVFDLPSEGPAPLPGGASVSEAAPDDVFGPAGPSPSAPPSGGGRRPIAEPPPLKLSAADLKIVWQGEDRSGPETMRLDMSNDSGGHELTDSEIDARFRTKEDAILACIARARPNESTDIPGRVTVKFHIQRTGTVKGVQVEAPVILHRGGLTGCIKNVLGGLRFPASGTGQVVSFPFSLM